MAETNLFTCDKKILSSILQIYETSEKSLNEDVQSLKKWIKTQPHLPEILDDKCIQNCLIFNKFSIERAKKSIDMYYTIRARVPEIFSNANPKNPSFQEAMDIAHWVFLPTLTKEMYRVNWFKVYDTERAELIEPFQILKIGCCVQEVRLKEDVMFGDVCVFDSEGLPMSYFFKITPVFLTKMILFYEKIYSIPLKGMYYLNAPPILNSILNVMKTMLKPKIFQRIHVCKDSSILSEVFPEEMIPADYGGKGKSMKELNDMLKIKLKQYQSHFDLLDKIEIDESLRPEKLKNDEVLGFHGNFKKLDVD